MKKLIRLLSFIFIFYGFMFIYVENVSAYIDPSVVTYSIQAIAGIAIAVGAFFGVYFRKIKKNVSKKLNIDENKNKETESDDIVISKKK